MKEITVVNSITKNPLLITLGVFSALSLSLFSVSENASSASSDIYRWGRPKYNISNDIEISKQFQNYIYFETKASTGYLLTRVYAIIFAMRSISRDTAESESIVDLWRLRVPLDRDEGI